METRDPGERLEYLRAADSRPWFSLEDKRVCSACERVFSGNEIEFGPSRDGGDYELACPTPGCQSSLWDWKVWTAPSAKAPSADGDGFSGEVEFI